MCLASRGFQFWGGRFWGRLVQVGSSVGPARPDLAMDDHLADSNSPELLPNQPWPKTATPEAWRRAAGGASRLSTGKAEEVENRLQQIEMAFLGIRGHGSDGISPVAHEGIGLGP